MLLTVSGLSKHYGVDEILVDATFRLDRRTKAGLVGRNGAGKTTLVRILTGEETPTSGSIHYARDTKVAALRQEEALEPSLTVIQAAEQARRHALELRSRLDALESKMEQGVATPEDLEEYTSVHERFVDAEGYHAERDLGSVLARMGFEELDYDKPVSSLSGGETTRLALARLLLEEPDLLILDEPTNHLDMVGIEWLERWIRGYHGAVLIVSHDRVFLQNTVDDVIDLREGRTKTYSGGFEAYLRQRREEEARQAEVARREQEQIDKLDEYVRRFMGNQRTAQARGRRKMMERLIQNRTEGPRQEKHMAAGFRAVQRSGDVVMECRGLGMRFERTLFSDLDWTVRWSERWGVVGDNGVGKSTLVRLCLGLIEPTTGTARLGANVQAGYFNQTAEDLDDGMTPLQFMIEECGLLVPEARDLLGRFLFSGDDVFRPIGTFSGGEKNKLALARLTVLNPNLLILDEPTNHLDMPSRDALANVLRDYGGTLVVVSHDRWFLDQVTNHTLALHRDSFEIYAGSFSALRQWRERQTSGTVAPKTAPKKVETAHTTVVTMSPRELSKEIQRLGREMEVLETQIAEREADLTGIEARLADPLGEDVATLSRRHSETQQELETLMHRWTETGERLDDLRRQQGG